jgi:hypothetical protein
MAQGRPCFIVADVWSKARHGGGAGVTESTVPEIRVLLENEGGMVKCLAHGVEWSGAIASKHHGPGEKVLHRETIRIKLDRTRIINSELTNKN